MGYRTENYRRIRAAYQTKYLKAYAEAERRMEDLHRLSPELAQIDKEMAGFGAQIAMAALCGGEDNERQVKEIEQRNGALQERRAALLAELGYPADYTLPPYECSKCNDTGFVDTKMCECMRRELIMAAYASSGLGELMQTQSFESFSLDYYTADEALTMKRNFEMLKAYAENFNVGADNLIFIGATGLGKTHLSTAIAHRVIDRGFDVYYTGAIRMFSDFERARFGKGEESGADITRYGQCDLLIIDDFGTEVTNQFTTSCMYMVLDERLNLRRPTIINTNLTGKEIKARYGDRIASRILNMFKPFVFVGNDVRFQKLRDKK